MQYVIIVWDCTAIWLLYKVIKVEQQSSLSYIHISLLYVRFSVSFSVHSHSQLQSCMRSRKDTAGSIQATNTEVELLAFAVTPWGTEGTEGGKEQDSMYFLVSNKSILVQFPMYTFVEGH